jgi:hypothetical protein
MRGRLMRTLGRRRQDDEGFALASVVAMMLLGAIIVTIMLTATMRTIGTTTATRASVQAKAAAQAGVDAARAMLDAGTCTAGTITGTNPSYTVTLHPSTGQNATASLPIGCPTSTSRSVMVVATGTASALGTGNDAGDARAVEALLVKPGDSPRFDKAAFGLKGVTANTSLTIVDASAATSADIFTEGAYTCSSAQRLEGDLYAKGDILLSSGPCKVDGTVLTEGTFTCAAGTVIGGDLYVGGDAVITGQCEVKGVVIIGGNLRIDVGGVKFGTSLTVGGSITGNDVPASTVQTVTLGGSLLVGTSWHAIWVSTYGARLQENVASVPAPPQYPSEAEDAFPQLTADDPQITTGFTSKPWKTTISSSMSGLSWSPDPCNLSAWVNAFPNPIVININTRFDARSDCGSITLGNDIWFELNADLVIVANSISQNGHVHFTSGDGQKHSVYLVVPWTSGATTCNPYGNGMNFESGNWTQDASTAVMLYSSGPISVKTQPQFYGQMYGCTLALSTTTTLTYSPVGATVDPSTVPWSLSYIRDEG